MKPRWFKRQDEEQSKKLKADFMACSVTRDRLVEMLEDDIDKSLKQMRDAAKGQIPNLTEYYADELSKQSTLEDVISLIKEN